MTYYPTLGEDIARAKAILKRGIVGGDLFAVEKLLESFVEVLTKQPPVDVDLPSLQLHDRQLLSAIVELAARADSSDFQLVTRIRAYWRDADRADRTPKEILILHLGITLGLAANLLDIQL